MSNNPIFVADIGGTKSLFALAEKTGDHFQLYEKRYYNNNEYSSGYSVVSTYLQSIRRAEISNGVFGVAGHVKNNSVFLTNRNWQFDEVQLKKDFGFHTIKLVNDLEAMTKGVLFLKETDYIGIQKGVPQKDGNICVIAAGTGLGEATAVYCKGIKDYHVIPGEGGQAGFSAANNIQSDLWNYILETDPGASIESLLSGSGLSNIYQYLIKDSASSHPKLNSILEEENSAAEISKRAISGEDEYCKKTVEIFISIYANEARNFAFRMLPYGGLFLGGGIAPKIFGENNSTRFLQRKNTFLKTFLKKSKMENFLENIPVYLITSEDTALYGAAAFTEFS